MHTNGEEMLRAFCLLYPALPFPMENKDSPNRSNRLEEHPQPNVLEKFPEGAALCKQIIHRRDGGGGREQMLAWKGVGWEMCAFPHWNASSSSWNLFCGQLRWPQYI